MPSSPPRWLTETRLKVLRLLAIGRTNREIATQLFVAESTVKWHVSTLLVLYGAANRADLVREAIARGHIPSEPFAIPSSDTNGR